MNLRILIPLAWLMAATLLAAPAHASGDFTCTPAWKLAKTVFTDCDNTPMLSPANDSRVNLQLQLIDAGLAKIEPPPKSDPPAPPIADSASPFTFEDFQALIGPRPPGAPADADSNPDYASGEGSRCRSNDAGATAYQDALGKSSAVPEAERAILAAARKAVTPACDAATASTPYPPPDGVRSPLGRQFARYLAGTAEFYGGDYDDARKDFAAAAASSQPWLKETATYMLGRVPLNQAQATAFDEFGLMHTDKVDGAALKDAGTAFQAYLKAYPAGQYAASARGLLRRVAWLGGEPKQMGADYAWAFAHAGPDDRNVAIGDLVLEADQKLLTQTPLGTDLSDPALLATRDLMGMRHDPADPKSLGATIKYEDLEAQRPTFASQPALFEYLLAAHRFYVENDAAGALAHLGAPAPSGPMTSFVFSQQVLRGLALERQKELAGARALWLQLTPLARPAFQRPMLDLALAMNEERDGRLAQVFAAGSPIHDPQVREILLRHDAGPALLVQQIKAQGAPDLERRVARYVLLYKDVMRGRYVSFAADAALTAPQAPPPADPNNPPADEPDFKLFAWAGHAQGYLCEELPKLAKALAAAPSNPHNVLCLGEFARLNNLDANGLNAGAPADELGGVASQFPGQTFARLDAYKQLIADAKTPPADRAYALYRAINCYAPSGNNECDGKTVPQSERARWFHLLKGDYPKSEWATALKYYW
jgi:hypothetical protein